MNKSHHFQNIVDSLAFFFSIISFEASGFFGQRNNIESVTEQRTDYNSSYIKYMKKECNDLRSKNTFQEEDIIKRQDSGFEVFPARRRLILLPLEDEEHSNPRMNFREIH